MSREMVREGRRPPVVVGTEPDRDELLARIAMLELDLRIANKALAKAFRDGARDEGDVFVTWEDDEGWNG